VFFIQTYLHRGSSQCIANCCWYKINLLFVVKIVKEFQSFH